jgi:predicted  nucleic acid-binding Zn-ribbon protein
MSDPQDENPQGPTQLRDVIGQLQQVLRYVERSMLLLEPVPKELRPKYEELRRLRDKLEETFTLEQTERLRQGSLDFSAEVDELKKVTADLEEATKRAAKAKEVIGYLSMAVDLIVRVLATLLPFLGI